MVGECTCEKSSTSRRQSAAVSMAAMTAVESAGRPGDVRWGTGVRAGP